jgi:hypothetical protein
MILNPYRYGGGSFPFATWNAADKSANVDISPTVPLQVNRSGGATTYQGVRATKAVTAKAYWEITASWGGVGVRGGAGLALSSLTLTTNTDFPGSAAGGVAIWGPNNTVYLAGTPTDYANSTGTDTYGFAFDPATGKLWIRAFDLASTYIGGGDPVAGTSPTVTITAGTSYYPIASMASGVTDGIVANFGQNAFTGTPPTGYGNV